MTIDKEVDSLAFRMHRNFLKRNQATSLRRDYVEFIRAARAFLGLSNDAV